jgi:hypothetical protein
MQDALGMFQQQNRLLSFERLDVSDIVSEIMGNRRFRITFEVVTPFSENWIQTQRESTNLGEVLDQYETLKEWEKAGEEQVRNITLEFADVEWTKFVPQ